MIRIDEHFSLAADTHCVALYYEKQGDINPETGKHKVSKWETYHANVEQALKKWKDEILKTPAYDDAVHDFGILIDKIEEVDNKITELSTKLKL